MDLKIKLNGCVSTKINTKFLVCFIKYTRQAMKKFNKKNMTLSLKKKNCLYEIETNIAVRRYSTTIGQLMYSKKVNLKLKSSEDKQAKIE